MDGRMGGWMDRSVDGQMKEYMDGWMSKWQQED